MPVPSRAFQALAKELDLSGAVWRGASLIAHVRCLRRASLAGRADGRCVLLPSSRTRQLKRPPHAAPGVRSFLLSPFSFSIFFHLLLLSPSYFLLFFSSLFSFTSAARPSSMPRVLKLWLASCRTPSSRTSYASTRSASLSPSSVSDLFLLFFFLSLLQCPFPFRACVLVCLFLSFPAFARSFFFLLFASTLTAQESFNRPGGLGRSAARKGSGAIGAIGAIGVALREVAQGHLQRRLRSGGPWALWASFGLQMAPGNSPRYIDRALEHAPDHNQENA